MPLITSGSVLRETRERKNYDLNTVARRLRIRPDILRAIEASDFAAMPPQAQARMLELLAGADPGNMEFWKEVLGLDMPDTPPVSA